MRKIIVEENDKWIVDVSDEEYEQLREGTTEITELLAEKKVTGEAQWRNGSTDWY